MARAVALRAARTLVPRSVPSHSCPFRALQSHSGRRLIHNSQQRPYEALGTAAKLSESEHIPVPKRSDVVTISDIKERRTKAGKLVAGTAASCDSDMFKAPVSFLYPHHFEGNGANVEGIDDWET